MSIVSNHRRALAWKAGAKAFENGKPKSANNRPPCTIYHDDWADGWNDARYQHEGQAGRAKGGSA